MKCSFLESLQQLQSLTHSTRLDRQQPFQEVGDTHAALSFANQLGYWLFCGEEKLLFFSGMPSVETTRIQWVTLNSWTYRLPTVSLVDRRTK